MSGNAFLPTAILKHLSGTDQNRQVDSFFSLYQVMHHIMYQAVMFSDLQNISLGDLDDQQAALYKWEYIQHGVVTFWVDDDDFDPVSSVTDIQ